MAVSHPRKWHCFAMSYRATSRCSSDISFVLILIHWIFHPLHTFKMDCEWSSWNPLFSLFLYKAKKNKYYVAKLVTDWKTWPKCVFFNVFFFFFFFSWAADVSDLSQSQLWNMELDFWMNKIQYRTQCWRSLLFKVFFCVYHIFSCIFWQASS